MARHVRIIIYYRHPGNYTQIKKNHTSATSVLNLQIDPTWQLLQTLCSNYTASPCSRRFNNDQAISVTLSSYPRMILGHALGVCNKYLASHNLINQLTFPQLRNVRDPLCSPRFMSDDVTMQAMRQESTTNDVHHTYKEEKKKEGKDSIPWP